MMCPFYAEFRNSLFSDIARLSPDFLRLDVNQQCLTILSDYSKFLAKYIDSAWQKRQGVLFTTN